MNKIKIDEILNEIHSSAKYIPLYEDDFDDFADFVVYRDLLILMSEDTKLIKKPSNQNSILYLTKFGNDVISQGGWIKYLENEKRTNERTEQKAVFDFQISKIQAKTKLFPYIVSVVSLIISLFAYFKKEDKAEIGVSKSEITKVIDSISISNQTKKADSLHNSKSKDYVVKTTK